MDLIKYSRQKFLEAQSPVLDGLIKEGKKTMQIELDKSKMQIAEELFVIFEKLSKKHKRLHNEKLLGKAELIYISFLRGGILLHMPCYRIDLYDENDRVSEIECSQRWEPGIFNEIIRKGEETLTANFSRQSSAGMYFCEEMTLCLAEKLHDQFTLLLPEVLQLLEQKQEKNFSSSIRVFMGEFLDISQQIYAGRL